VEQGYPFFAGEMTIEKQICLEDADCKLRLVGRFALAEVYINDKFVSKLMFDDVCDLTGYADKGLNNLKVKLINSNRNFAYYRAITSAAPANVTGAVVVFTVTATSDQQSMSLDDVSLTVA
jgi:hypothetical protein